METAEKVLIIMKPDCVQRALMGEILGRFERKGLRVMGLKMAKLGDVVLEEHYFHHKDKPFFLSLKAYMRAAPVVLVALSGLNAIKAVRLLAGATKGYEADAGTIRGDFSLSTQSNIIHASDSPENGEIEIKRFFKKEELFEYKKIGQEYIYSDSFPNWG